jgi:hypothetical protein
MPTWRIVGGAITMAALLALFVYFVAPWMY